jgi:hypothetical protein
MKREINIEDLIKSVDNLVNNIDIIQTYEFLAKLFKDSGMYEEYASCLERLWHKTQNHKLYVKIGDIYKTKLNNSQIALLAYNRYLYHTNREFSEKYLSALSETGTFRINKEDLTEDCDAIYVDLSDKYNSVINILYYLANKQEYSTLLRCSYALDDIRNRIDQFYKTNIGADKSYLDEMDAQKKHLIDLLIKVHNHNDINRFVIKLDDSQRLAYINIVADLVTYKKYDEAISFYNETYCGHFKFKKLNSIIDICWDLSDIYRDNYMFYDAVHFQQIALEIELTEQN